MEHSNAERPDPKRTVLAEDTTLDDVNDLAWDEGWFLYSFTEPSSDQPYEKIWMTEDRQTAVHYVDDDMIGVRYIAIEGANQKETLRRIRECIGMMDDGDLLRLLHEAEAEEDVIRAVHRIGVGAPPSYDEAFFDAFEKALNHPSSKVRKAVVTAIGYAKWREFEELLRTVADQDSDLEVRDLAAFLLKSFSRHSWREESADE